MFKQMSPVNTTTIERYKNGVPFVRGFGSVYICQCIPNRVLYWHQLSRTEALKATEKEGAKWPNIERMVYRFDPSKGCNDFMPTRLLPFLYAGNRQMEMAQRVANGDNSAHKFSRKKSEWDDAQAYVRKNFQPYKIGEVVVPDYYYDPAYHAWLTEQNCPMDLPNIESPVIPDPFFPFYVKHDAAWLARNGKFGAHPALVSHMSLYAEPIGIDLEDGRHCGIFYDTENRAANKEFIDRLQLHDSRAAVLAALDAVQSANIFTRGSFFPLAGINRDRHLLDCHGLTWAEVSDDTVVNAAYPQSESPEKQKDFIKNWLEFIGSRKQK